MQNPTEQFYLSVIDKTISDLYADFNSEGVDPAVVHYLKEMWTQRLRETRVVDPPEDQDELDVNDESIQLPNSITLNAPLPLIMTPQASLSYPHTNINSNNDNNNDNNRNNSNNSNNSTSNGDLNNNINGGNNSNNIETNNSLFLPISPNGSTLFHDPASELTGSNSQPENTNGHGSNATSPNTNIHTNTTSNNSNSTSNNNNNNNNNNGVTTDKSANGNNRRKKKNKKRRSNNDFGDDDDDDNDEGDDNEDNDDDDDDDGDDDGEKGDNDEDELGSDLDDEEDEEPDSSQAGNLMLCIAEKVNRVRNRWKIQIQGGVLTLDARDYAFNKASGDFQF